MIVDQFRGLPLRPVAGDADVQGVQPLAVAARSTRSGEPRPGAGETSSNAIADQAGTMNHFVLMDGRTIWFAPDDGCCRPVAGCVLSYRGGGSPPPR
ncbi:hypothetical protein [Actinoplanes nipponensis]|uniref:hypothetical protein n=1 Tax=Actinoplanes nipponensis TaxID=135950 RepID=UPI0031EF8836